MAPSLVTGFGAGLVSALLFAVSASGSLLAVALYILAPLPILIAGLGWNHRGALAGALAGAAILALAFTPLAGLVYVAVVALPAWWFAYLLLLARDAAGGAEWYPLGRLLLWIAVIAAALTAVGAALVSTDYDAFVGAFHSALAALDEADPELLSAVIGADRDASLQDVARLMALAAPPISAAIAVIVDVVLIYAAARICKASGRLPRPWPRLASTTLPFAALIVLAASLAGGLVLDRFAGLAARSLFAAVLSAYFLQGLAALHGLTLGVGARGAILTAAYVLLALIPGWPVLALAALGLADALFGLRARRNRARPPAASV